MHTARGTGTPGWTLPSPSAGDDERNPTTGPTHPFTISTATPALSSSGQALRGARLSAHGSKVAAHAGGSPSIRAAITAAAATAFVIPHLSYPLAIRIRSSVGSNPPTTGNWSAEW
ncbi:hypothetical protein GS921_25680 [Rhodococcus hoagii]|nr:hypothetical protein [Prescottella equi]